MGHVNSDWNRHIIKIEFPVLQELSLYLIYKISSVRTRQVCL